MILDISYSNVRVFRDQAAFSMEASEAQEKSENIIYTDLDGETVRTLKVGAIYGPNSSGKTTLIYVIFMLRDWVLNNPCDYLSDIIAPFALDDSSTEKPSIISIRFISGGRLLNYTVGFSKGKCCQETLIEEHNNKNDLLFKRIVTKFGPHGIEYGHSIGNEVPAMEVAPDKSILAIFNNLTLPSISAAANYIASIEIANSYNRTMMKILLNQIRPWLNKNGNKRRLVEFENCFDINIKDIKIPQKPESTPYDIKYVHTKIEKGQNKTRDIEFRAELESSGTQVLTLLGAKVLQALDEGRVLMVDEFDSGFHTEVTRTVIEMFRDPVINNKGAQLILTTHNVSLMDENVLRKDQIWFIEKNQEGLSELFSLAEFDEVTEQTNFSEWYLAKRFGAVPHPDMLALRFLFSHEDSANS